MLEETILYIGIMQIMGQLAAWLRMKVDGFVPRQYNEVKGQPFKVAELVAAFTEILNKE